MRNKRAARRLALRYLAAVAVTILFLFPIYWLFMISFKTPDEIFHYPPVWWPHAIQFANYGVLFKDGDVTAARLTAEANAHPQTPEEIAQAQATVALQKPGKPDIFVQLGHSALVSTVAISPDGRYALSGSSDKTLKLWDLATGRAIRTFKGHSQLVSSVAFSPDGKMIASGSHEQVVKLWDVGTGNLIRSFVGHRNTIHSVAFSPDRQYLASASGDRTVGIWNIVTGQEVQVLRGHSDSVDSVAFSPDGRYLASGSQDNTINLWRWK